MRPFNQEDREDSVRQPRGDRRYQRITIEGEFRRDAVDGSARARSRAGEPLQEYSAVSASISAPPGEISSSSRDAS
jgi:hypothetical protein